MDEDDADDPGLLDAALGDLVADHRAGSPLHVGLIRTAVVLALAAGAAAVVASGGMVARGGGTEVTLALGATAPFVAAPSAAAAVLFLRLRWRAFVCESGFAVARTSGTDVVLWSDVEAVFEDGNAAGVWRAVRVRTRSGRVVTLGGIFRGYDALAEAVHRGVTAELMPAAAAAVDAGRGVRFGALSVSAGGVTDGATSVPWADVAAVGPFRGRGGCHIGVRAAGRAACLTQPVAAFPNVELFLALARRCRPPQ